MHKEEYFRQLTDAIDLLAMVERLTDGLSRETTAHEQVPWAGIRLTLRQTKGLIFSAYERLLENQSPHSAFMDTAETSSNYSSKSSGASLADRIQQAPTSAGRVRELLQPGGNSADNVKA